jgi:molecular chaperone DnaK (HSP70)
VLVVGIDLGTTNTAVAWVDAGERLPRVHHFPVPQLVAEGELAPRPTLPSFLYLAGEHDLPPAATRLPWDPEARVVVGELARSQGARVPSRLVASSKSWLSHAGVDRQAAILPWGAAESPKLSPVDAAARVLGHVAHAWQHAGRPPLATLEVVVTVPASFDEVARELTLAAAARAGLEAVTLVEEPQAVFYAWIDANDAARRRQSLKAGERVLVCDVGGGTTDFTIIDVGADGESFARSAVGDHLLLGGDNIDVALARRVETRLAGKLDAVQWHGLVHACRLAKELLLSREGGKPPHQAEPGGATTRGDDAVDAVPVSVAARGSKLIGGVLRAEVTRAEVDELVLGGFFPLVARDARPERQRAGLSELGLPYASDAAITRHLAAFLGRHGVARIDAVLFNGGAMKPAAVRRRLVDQLAAWQPGAPAPRELHNVAPDIAVAHGAAYYGLVRRGLGARISGGAARAYYVGVDLGAPPSASPPDGRSRSGSPGGAAVCVLPRGAEEGTERELGQDFLALTNRPVSFRLYSSSARAEHPGDLVRDAQDADDLVELPPLVTVLRAPGRRDARVRVHARLTEVGTLELWCVAEAEKWRLTFDLRAGGAPPPDAGELPADIEELRELARASFPPLPGRLVAPSSLGQEARTPSLQTAPPPSSVTLRGPPGASLIKELERRLGSRRDEWGTALIRGLWDAVYELEPARAQSAEIEARWLNLAGFLLRPGAGAPLDDWRVREMWKVFNAGLAHEKDESCRLAWWIVWRRIAAGLKRGQQDQFYDRLAALFVPSAAKKGKLPRYKPSPQETAEMWRTLASMERIVASSKVKLGEALLERLEKGRDVELGMWALGRLGARAPLYGPADTVVSPSVAARWIDRVLALPWNLPERMAFPAAQLGRRTGDRARDVDDAVRERLAARLRSIPGGERTARLVEEIVALEAREERVAFGDTLPAGLRRLDLDEG